jgi:hypothetical protein
LADLEWLATVYSPVVGIGAGCVQVTNRAVPNAK